MTAASADLTSLALALRNAGSNAEPDVHQLLADTASQVQSLAVSMAPVKTGALRDSIHIVWEGESTVVITSDLHYAPFQEFGTGELGEFPGKAWTITPKNGKYLVFTVGGKKVFAKKVTHRGNRPHPFMRPALMQALGSAAGELADIGALQITKGSK